MPTSSNSTLKSVIEDFKSKLNDSVLQNNQHGIHTIFYNMLFLIESACTKIESLTYQNKKIISDKQLKNIFLKSSLIQGEIKFSESETTEVEDVNSIINNIFVLISIMMNFKNAMQDASANNLIQNFKSQITSLASFLQFVYYIYKNDFRKTTHVHFSEMIRTVKSVVSKMIFDILLNENNFDLYRVIGIQRVEEIKRLMILGEVVALGNDYNAFYLMRRLCLDERNSERKEEMENTLSDKVEEIVENHGEFTALYEAVEELRTVLSSKNSDDLNVVDDSIPQETIEKAIEMVALKFIERNHNSASASSSSLFGTGKRGVSPDSGYIPTPPRAGSSPV